MNPPERSYLHEYSAYNVWVKWGGNVKGLMQMGLERIFLCGLKWIKVWLLGPEFPTKKKK